MEWLGVLWLAGIVWSTALAAFMPQTVWWVGLVSGVLLGPFGVALVGLDIATYQPGTRGNVSRP